jgi:lipoate-protein ligase A
MDLTLSSAAENLACDEALLDACEDGSGPEVLRFWEPSEYFVVVGFSNSVASEVNLEACKREGIPVLRRCSGGGTILQGPGCLNYTLILKIADRPEVETIPITNHFVMTKQREAVAKVLGRAVEIRGLTDLCIDGKKFSGNAQRRKRRALIFHGTFLLHFDLSLVEKFLTMPSREPDYRKGRPHGQFLMNLNTPTSDIKTALRNVWRPTSEMAAAPDCRRLIAEKYSRDEWNLKI